MEQGAVDQLYHRHIRFAVFLQYLPGDVVAASLRDRSLIFQLLQAMPKNHFPAVPGLRAGDVLPVAQLQRRSRIQTLQRYHHCVLQPVVETVGIPVCHLGQAVGALGHHQADPGLAQEVLAQIFQRLLSLVGIVDAHQRHIFRPQGFQQTFAHPLCLPGGQIAPLRQVEPQRRPAAAHPLNRTAQHQTGLAHAAVAAQDDILPIHQCLLHRLHRLDMGHIPVGGDDPEHDLEPVIDPVVMLDIVSGAGLLRRIHHPFGQQLRHLRPLDAEDLSIELLIPQQVQQVRSIPELHGDARLLLPLRLPLAPPFKLFGAQIDGDTKGPTLHGKLSAFLRPPECLPDLILLSIPQLPGEILALPDLDGRRKISHHHINAVIALARAGIVGIGAVDALEQPGTDLLEFLPGSGQGIFVDQILKIKFHGIASR